MQNSMIIAVIALMASFCGSAFGFEDTKTLPEGIRNITVKNVYSQIDQESDANGKLKPLAEPMNRELKFGDIVKGESGLKQTQLKGFLLANGFSEKESVGSFRGDIKAQVMVNAPIFAFGLSERWTMALAIPYFRAKTDVKLGFKPNENGQAFLTKLSDPAVNSVESAREAGLKLNDGVGELNRKLLNNGYQSLSPWEESGIGDVTIASKYRFQQNQIVKSAFLVGVTAPTGRVDDPDILNDLGFGDGSWDLFGGMTWDQYVTPNLYFNENLKYTVQMPADKKVRMLTKTESVEVENETVNYKPGDKVESGLSLQWEPPTGILGGIGYVYNLKFMDIYNIKGETKGMLQAGTREDSHAAEAKLGYSTVPAYFRGSFPMPLSTILMYKYVFASRSMPVSHQAEVDFSLFF